MTCDADRSWIEQLPALATTRVLTVVSVPGERINSLWRVDTDDGPLAVRRNVTLVDRELEGRVARRAAEAGLSPPVLACEPQVLITRWVEGGRWTVADLADPDRVGLLMRLLRELHALPADDLPATGWQTELPKLQQSVGLADHQQLTRRVRELGGRLADHGFDEQAWALCHHDLHAGQIVGDFPRLLDFEYARRADPAVDLAWLMTIHDLPMDQQRQLIAAYYGREDRAILEKVALAVELTQLLDFLWLTEHEGQLGADQRQRLRRLKLVLVQ